MGDAHEVYKIIREEDKERKARNLAAADPEGWDKRSEFHWQRTLAGEVIDYWPSRNKWRYQGKTRVGDIKGWLRKKERQIT